MRTCYLFYSINLFSIKIFFFLLKISMTFIVFQQPTNEGLYFVQFNCIKNGDLQCNLNSVKSNTCLLSHSLTPPGDIHCPKSMHTHSK